jgi:hypothetical protein
MPHADVARVLSLSPSPLVPSLPLHSWGAMTGFKLSSPSNFEPLVSLFLVIPGDFSSSRFFSSPVLVVWFVASHLEYYWSSCSLRKWITYWTSLISVLVKHLSMMSTARLEDLFILILGLKRASIFWQHSGDIFSAQWGVGSNSPSILSRWTCKILSGFLSESQSFPVHCFMQGSWLCHL